VCVGSGGFACCFDANKAVNVELSLKALVSSLIEEPFHDGFFELDGVVNLESVVGLPRDEVVEASPYTFIQHHVKFPRKRRVATACSFGQVFHVYSLN